MSFTVETSPPLVPIALPRLSEAEVQRTHALVGVHREFPFTWSGKAAVLRFTAVEAAPAASGWLHLRLGDHSLALGLPALPEVSALGANFAGIEIAALPDDLIVGVLEAWIHDAVEALKPHNIPLQLENWCPEETRHVADFGWEISWDGRERFLTGSLAAGPEVLGFLAGLALRAAPRARAGSREGSVPFACHVAVATALLPWAELKTLEVGDVVLVAATRTDLAAGHCELWAAGRRIAAARREGAALKILTMNASLETKANTAAAGALRVDELPVQLLFDVGTLDVTIQQLRTVGEGYTFELPGAVERLVTIRANGREIGQGELVDVGGKVGVRIVNWLMS
jgi:type III secretion protein Q